MIIDINLIHTIQIHQSPTILIAHPHFFHLDSEQKQN